MSTVIRNITVFAASGSLGTILVEALDKAGFVISAITRPTSLATFPENITVHRVSYDDLEGLTKAFQGQDAIVSTIGTFGASEQLTAIEAAIAAGVYRFLPSEYGGNTSLEGVINYPPFALDKKRVIDRLHEAEDNGLTWTALCTGIFFSWVLEQGNGTLGWDIAKREVTIYDSGDQQFDTSTIDQLVSAVISVLHHPDETANQYVYVNSFTLTQNLLLSTLERLQGVKYDKKVDTTAAIVARGEYKLSHGDNAGGYPDIVTGSVYAPWRFSHFEPAVVARWKETLGLREVEHVETVISEVLRKNELLL